MLVKNLNFLPVTTCHDRAGTGSVSRQTAELFPSSFPAGSASSPPQSLSVLCRLTAPGFFRKVRAPGMGLEQRFLENAAVPRECGSSSGALPLQVCGARCAAGVRLVEPSPAKRERPSACGAHWMLLLATQGSTWAMEREAGEGSRQVIPDPPGPARAGATLTSV